MRTRCKLRCVTIETHVHGSEGHPPWKSAKLAPVMGKGQEENVAFWKSTPNGSMNIPAEGRFDTVFEVGAFYYVDIASDPDNVLEDEQIEKWEPWELTSCTAHGHDAGADVQLNAKTVGATLGHGDIRLQIDNPYAAQPFVHDFVESYDARCAAYEKHTGDQWRVPYPPKPAYYVRVQRAE